MTRIIYSIETLSWQLSILLGYLPNKQHEIKMHDIQLFIITSYLQYQVDSDIIIPLTVYLICKCGNIQCIFIQRLPL